MNNFDNNDRDNRVSNRKNKKELINSKYGSLFDFCPKITHYISEVSKDLENQTVCICGRVVNYRNSKMFIIIREQGMDLQCYCNVKLQDLKEKLKLLDIGDYVLFRGIIKYSNTNVLTLFVENLYFAAKCVIDAPDQYYIQKYQDIYTRKTRTEYLTFHKQSFNNLYLRYLITQFIREFFINNNFCEVETPVLQRIAGGAFAKPFETEYLDKKDIFQLRISPELYLKRLIITGFNRIFEISRNFRNEGLSVNHNPEFSMLETYVMYWHLSDMIEFLLKMIDFIIIKLIEYKNYLSETQIDFLKKISTKDIKYYNFYNIIQSELGTTECFTTLLKALKQNNIIYNSVDNISFEDLCDDYISKVFVKKFSSESILCIQNYPTKLSPLAKHKDGYALRFEIYLGGIEIIDGFEENNDYEKQLSCFEEQYQITSRKFDNEYINDMKIGFPFTTGAGIGIDRIVLLLLGCKNIRDVISYTD